MVPLGMIFYRTFEDGLMAFWEQVTTPAAISAINLSLIDRGDRRAAERDLRRSSRRWRSRAGAFAAVASSR